MGSNHGSRPGRSRGFDHGPLHGAAGLLDDATTTPAQSERGRIHSGDTVTARPQWIRLVLAGPSSWSEDKPPETAVSVAHRARVREVVTREVRRIAGTTENYSYLRAVMGSTRAARRAGI
jgi:hypothetical protein